MYEYALYHHGIKGQRWGVRRFQKKDGTLTDAGKKRYGDSDDTSVKKSKYRTKLENRYMEAGMSREDAEIAASGKIKTQKVVGVIAGVTVAAATAYLVTQYVKERTDQVIKSGSNLQRIEGKLETDTTWFNKNKNLHNSFYATTNKTDNKNYADAFGYIKKKQYGSAYQLDISAKKDLKIASQKKARDTLRDLLTNDDEFRDHVLTYGYLERNLRNGNKIPQKYITSLKKGEPIPERIMRKMYDNYNSQIVESGVMNTLRDMTDRGKFYGALQKQGYSGIQDINDLKYSRLRGENPLIIFDKAKVKVSKIRDITDAVSEDKYNKAYARMDVLRGTQAASKALPALAGVSVTSLAALIPSSKSKAFVRKYKAEHPDTELTNREIESIYLKKIKDVKNYG